VTETTLTDSLTLLATKGTEVITGLWDAIQTKWDEVSAWLGTVGTLIFDAIGDLSQTLISRGEELITGMRLGVDTMWHNLEEWLISLGTLIFDAIGSLAETLISRGEELFTGMRSGIDTKWAEITDWLGTVATLVADAIGDLSEALVAKGEELIGGFLAGLQSAWQAVVDWASSLSIPWPEFSGPSIPGVDTGSRPTLDFLAPLSGGGGGGRSGGSSSARQHGGPVSAFQPYWVGEEGPELLFPRHSGYVVPHRESVAMASGRGQTVNITIQRAEFRDMDAAVRMAERRATSRQMALARG
jgi:hypothetical protein